jgi:probable O-glycosylation ligase (exosortase A-associated)
MRGVQLVLLLQIPIGLSILDSTGPFLSADRYTQFEVNTVMSMMIPLMLETHTDIRNLLMVCALSEALLGSRIGLYGLLNGGGLLNFGHGRIYDSNELALAEVMLLPICWCLREAVESRWIKWLLIAIFLTAGAAVIMSNSRGSSLALAAVVVFVIFRSDRKSVALVAVILAIAPAVYLVQEQYVSRMKTLETYQDEESAASRVTLWQAAWDVWKEHPLLGVGFGNRNFAVAAGRYLGRDNQTVAHNSYLQMLVDSGIVAFLFYCGLLFGSIIGLGKSARRFDAAGSEARWLAIAVQGSLLAYAVGGTFYSHQRYDFAYMLFMTAAAWFAMENTELEACEDSSQMSEDCYILAQLPRVSDGS